MESLEAFGNWAAGVSGGADSVAMLRLLAEHTSEVHVAHFNHETRGRASDLDDYFAQQIALALGLNFTGMRRSTLRMGMAPTNPSTRQDSEASLRSDRFHWFRQFVKERNFTGLLLAHHADDRAETTLLRLLRGGEPSAVAGLRRDANIGGLRVCRPLLGVRRIELVAYLESIGQPWREDSSNRSDRFARNRARKFLSARPAMVASLLQLADAADALRDWTRSSAGTFCDEFEVDALADLPDVLTRFAGRQWLISHGSPVGEVSKTVVESLIAMARDRSTPARHMFPGGVTVRRTRGRFAAVKS